MAKKKKAAEKRGRGRPSKGPSVSVTFRLPKDVSDQLDELRRRAVAEVSRSAAMVALIKRGLEQDAKLFGED